MKICFLGLDNLPVLAREYNRHGIGGEQVQHTLLARALSQRGHDVSMVVYDYGQADGQVWDGITTWKAYRADAGLPGLRFIWPRWTGVWAALKRADADLYYVSCAGMHLGLVAMFCRRYGRKVVFKIAHDSDCDPNQLLIKYARDKKLYAWGLRHAHGILAQSEQQQRAMLANYGLASTVTEMIVDTPGKPCQRSVDILWVNNLRQFKRPDLLVEVARRMPQYQFAMIGGEQPGSAALFQEIQQQAASVPNLRFLGRVPYHDMDQHYAGARVFLNTSDSEGFPNSYLQAWIRGTPVVAFFDPDGVIAKEGLGRVPASLEQMQVQLQILLEDDHAWLETSLRCKAYMQRMYNDDRILAPYLAMFNHAQAAQHTRSG
jgi:glycosyltransferase involved in cell wall biosynthesis